MQHVSGPSAEGHSSGHQSDNARERHNRKEEGAAASMLPGSQRRGGVNCTQDAKQAGRLRGRALGGCAQSDGNSAREETGAVLDSQVVPLACIPGVRR